MQPDYMQQLHRMDAQQSYYAAMWKAAVDRALLREGNPAEIQAMAEAANVGGVVYPGAYAKAKAARAGRRV